MLRYRNGLYAISDSPNRLGKPLVGEPEDLWSARRGDDRIIYEIFDDDGSAHSPRATPA